MVHNGHDVGQALARTRAASEDVGLLLLRLPNAVGLVFVEEQLFSCEIALRLVDAKDLGTLRVEGSVCNEVIDGSTRLKSRVQLKEGLRPEGSRLELRFDFGENRGIGNFDEAPR